MSGSLALLLETGENSTWSSLSQLDRLASKPHGCSCLCLSSTGIKLMIFLSLIFSSLPSVLFIYLTSLRAWSVHGKGLMHGNVAFPNPNFSSLSLSYSQDHHLLITQFSMYSHQDIMYLLTTTHTWNSRLDTVIFSLQMTVVIFLSCTAHIRNSCLPSIQTYRKPGTSSDLWWPRLPQSLA